MKNFRLFQYTWLSITLAVFLALACTLSISLAVIAWLQKQGVFDSPVGLRGTPVIVFVLLMMAIGSLLSLIFASLINRPVNQMRRAMERVAEGDFSVRIPVTKNTEAALILSDFNQMVADLGSIETLRDDFIANVSHEFKTPISVIEGYATLLKAADISDDERVEYATVISESASKLSVLTSNILQLSKLEHQSFVIKQTTYSLDEQIRRSVLLFEKEWTEKNLELNIDLEETMYTGCEELLGQVWQNLIGNAVKFTDDGGSISVTLRHSDSCTVTVSDTGLGMTDEVIEHIFDKFYQGDKSRSASGNGLGLPLVKQIVSTVGGSISVESTPGVGSSFTVTLPIFR